MQILFDTILVEVRPIGRPRTAVGPRLYQVRISVAARGP